MSIQELSRYYNGFNITSPEGNNAFSWFERNNKTIFIAPFKSGTIDDLQSGSEIVFSEIDGGVEKNRSGLKYFLHISKADKHFFLFDNHNHAFFFWAAAIKMDVIPPGLQLVHVDQHSDMREPQIYIKDTRIKSAGLREIFHYTNFVLNVGNFIVPALKLNMFSQVEIIDSSTAFDRSFSPGIVLDIDMDIFSPEMDYIDYYIKITKIKELVNLASVITIASSPYFINQDTAIKIMKTILE